MCVWMCVHLCAQACGDQRFDNHYHLNYSPPYLLRQIFHLNPDLTHLPNLTRQLALKTLLHILSAGITGRLPHIPGFYGGAGDPKCFIYWAISPALILGFI